MDEIRFLTDSSIVIRILFSLVIGGILGLERGLKNRPAGLRTYILVCMGSCIVMMTNQYVYQVYGTGDPVRMAAQVISGIGFLGAGTIIVTRRNQIKGLTTAAGLWASACIGLSIGIGLYEVAHRRSGNLHCPYASQSLGSLHKIEGQGCRGLCRNPRIDVFQCFSS